MIVTLLILEALDFVYEVACSFESFTLHEGNIIPAIKNWDNIGDSVFSDMNSWIRLYIEKHLPENRKKEVEEFIGENNRWIEEHTEAFAA